MRFLGVIPARYHSTRLPAKMLASLQGKPLIQWVYEAACQCDELDSVLVATDDERIADVVRRFGGVVEMTAPAHPTGTDRIAEVAARHPGAEVIVNVQGDQPFVGPSLIKSLVSPFGREPEPAIATVAAPLTEAGRTDPNTVKVVCDQRMNALLFTRAAVPYYRQHEDAPVFHHLGLYAYRREALADYVRTPQTPLERCEQLEQLRFLENGYAIRVSLIDAPVPEVNTAEDLAQAHAYLERRDASH